MGESDARVLAEHAERGGDPGRAARGYRRAAEQALEGNDHDAAIARAEAGIACLAAARAAGAAPEGERELHGALRLVQAEGHRWRGENVETERLGLEAMRHLPRGGALWCRAAGEVGIASGRLAHGAGLCSVLDEIEAVAASDGIGPPLVTAVGRS